MWSQNPLTKKLGIQYPIIQGPFGGGFSTVRLASAVSNLGGLGSFGAHNLSPAQIKEKIAELKAATNKPFAVNLWVQSEDPETAMLDSASYNKIVTQYETFFQRTKANAKPFTDKFGEKFNQQVEAILEAKPPVFSFVFGIPDAAIIKRCKDLGIITVGAATTVAEALAVAQAEVDCVVVSGFEAAGHRPSFLKPSEDSLMGLSTLISQVAAQVKIPIIAAGGLSTAKEIAAISYLGADGFQLGTAFLACKESGASDVHRRFIFSKAAENTMLSRKYTGRLARFIRNDFLTQAEMLPHLPYPAHNYMLADFKKSATSQGLNDLAPMYAGQGAPLLKYKDTKSLMESLIAEIPKELQTNKGTKNV